MPAKGTASSVEKKINSKTKTKSTSAKATTTKKATATNTKKTKSTRPNKTSVQARATTKSTGKIKSTASSKSKSTKSTTEGQWNELEAIDLLAVISQIVAMRKRSMDGLKSLYTIDKILDRFNQHYTTAIRKFNAIVQVGMEKDANDLHESIYLMVGGRGNEEIELFKVLAEVGKGKLKLADAKKKIADLYQAS